MKRIIPVLLAALLLAGCANRDNSPEPNTDPTLPVENTWQEGGTLRLSMNVTRTLNPLLNRDVTVDRVLSLVFEPLAQRDETGKVVPHIAKSWDYDATGTVLTLRLDTSKTWHDGTAITAADVVYSLDTLAAGPADSVYRPCLDKMAGYARVDDSTVTITFQERTGGNLHALVFPVISAAYYGGGNAVGSAKDLAPMGNGPFAVASFRQGKELILEGRQNSFTARPHVDAVQVILVKDTAAAQCAFEQGITDVFLTDQVWEQAGVQAVPVATGQYEALGFSFRSATLLDSRIRQAVAYAIPREEIAAGAYLGELELCEGPLPLSSWLAQNQTRVYVYDAEKARELLAEAGWTDVNGDGYREKTINAFFDRLSLTLLVNEENTQRLRAAVSIRAALEVVGIQVEIVSVPYDTYVQRLQKGQFDLFLGGFSLSEAPDYRALFRSDGKWNYMGYQSPLTDTLLDRAYEAVGSEAQLTAYGELQNQLVQELPVLSLGYLNEALLVSDHVGGTVAPLAGDIFSGIENWYVVGE